MDDLRKIVGVDDAVGGYCLNFNGEIVFLAEDDLETHLRKYFKMREQLKKEKQLRKDNPTLADAWEKYRAILALTR